MMYIADFNVSTPYCFYLVYKFSSCVHFFFLQDLANLSGKQRHYVATVTQYWTQNVLFIFTPVLCTDIS